MNTEEYLKLVKKHPKPYDVSKYHISYEGELEDYNKIIEYNKKLISTYPFLLPHNVFSGKVIDGYNYEWTMADQIEDGWRLAFGKQLFDELLEVSNKFGYNLEIADDNGIVDTDITNLTFKDCWYFFEIKEKFGILRMYPSGVVPEIIDVINKYELKSRYTCHKCGKVATIISSDYILPWCNECFENRTEKYLKAINIKDYYNIKF